MDRTHSNTRSCRTLAGLCAAAVLGAFGCSQLPEAVPHTVQRGQTPFDRLPALTEPPPAAQLGTPKALPEKIAGPKAAPEKRAVPRGAPAEVLAEGPHRPLPLNLDTVFRLAQDQNAGVQIAREKLNEAFADRDVADSAWLPDLDVGVQWYRHEGGIQNERGRFIHSSFGALFAGLELHGRIDLREAVFLKVDAERKVWQKRGEVSKVTSETLLDASSTYVDLLAARTGEAIAREMEGNLSKLLDQAKKLAATDPGLQVEVDRINAELAAQKAVTRKAREMATSAAAKLLYLLGLDPCSEVVPMDPQLAPFHLVDASLPACDLVTIAQTQGPGVREMEGLLNLINSANEKAQGPGKYMPAFDVRVCEGVFGAGPGSRSDWDNRLDIVLGARWNVTELLTARDKQRANQAKIAQAHLAHQDLRGRLALGVQEAREASLSNREQMAAAVEQIKHARAAYKLSQYRLTENIPGRSPTEVLLAVRTLGGAQAGYLMAVRDYDKAQLRLLVLTGGLGNGHHGHDGHCPP